MKRSVRIASICIAVVALGLGGFATASGSAPDRQANDNGSSHSAPAAEPHTNASGVIVQTQFVPFTPCRLADTRHGGRRSRRRQCAENFSSTAPIFRFRVGTSAAAAFPTGRRPSPRAPPRRPRKGTGYLHARRVGNSEPAATVLNFTNLGFGGITVNAPIPVLSSLGSYGTVLKAYGAKTDAVVDVFGYYIEPIASSVNADGTTSSRSSQVLSVTHPSSGDFLLNFDQKRSRDVPSRPRPTPLPTTSESA